MPSWKCSKGASPQQHVGSGRSECGLEVLKGALTFFLESTAWGTRRFEVTKLGLEAYTLNLLGFSALSFLNPCARLICKQFGELEALRLDKALTAPVELCNIQMFMSKLLKRGYIGDYIGFILGLYRDNGK